MPCSLFHCATLALSPSQFLLSVLPVALCCLPVSLSLSALSCTTQSTGEQLSCVRSKANCACWCWCSNVKSSFGATDWHRAAELIRNILPCTSGNACRRSLCRTIAAASLHLARCTLIESPPLCEEQRLCLSLPCSDGEHNKEWCRACGGAGLRGGC